MDNKPLPIQVVLTRNEDIKKNLPGGSKKLMGEYTEELKNTTIEQFKNLLEFFNENFKEHPDLPCIGKVILKDKAIAKTHEPTRLLSKDNCPIIGHGKLNEIFIKVTNKGIEHAIKDVMNSDAFELKVNITKIEKIEPYTYEDILTLNVQENLKNIKNDKVKSLKIKLFDYRDDDDNFKCYTEFRKLISYLNLTEQLKEIEYSSTLKVFKLHTNDIKKINRILRFNGIKKISFFQDCKSINVEKETISNVGIESLPFPEVGKDYPIIGIIDSGIKVGHKYLEPWIYKREIYVTDTYQNNNHASFVAGILQYGHIFNNLDPRSTMFKILDVVALPNDDDEYGPTDTIDEERFLEIVKTVIKKHHNEVKI